MMFTAFIFRLLLAIVLGALIGLERQWRQKSAGLRTNTLVSMGAAAFILLSQSLTDDMGDPSRVAGQIVTGIGFLGAGVIMKSGLNISGLNTAATIWCSAAVGTLAGAGLWAEAVVTAAAVAGTHLLLRPLGLKMNRFTFKKDDSAIHYYAFRIRCKQQVENHIRVMILNAVKKDDHLQLRSLKSSDNGSPAFSYVDAEIMAIGKFDQLMEKLAGQLTLEYGVSEVSWQVNEEQQG
ncbi:MgtC/SapB family protein [Cytophagaceae bacterium ABcell3]|nr:MgtC/SapB family protein [Cytophagaceae bacterium ABcell3]